METNGTSNMTSDLYFYTHTNATEDEGRDPNVFFLAMSYMIFTIGKSSRIISTIGNTFHVRPSEQITHYESFTRWLLGGREQCFSISTANECKKKDKLDYTSIVITETGKTD